jgi:hypothetical protein
MHKLKFRIPDEMANRRLILLLGRIDDIDEAHLNGDLIGRTGRLRRGFSRKDIGGEYRQQRAYSIPMSLLIPNSENTLAVRIQDGWLHGGIYEGPVGLIAREKYTTRRERPG